MALAHDDGLSWDGTDLSATPIFLRVVSRKTHDMPKGRFFYADIAGADGGVSFLATDGPQPLSYDCKLAAANATDRATAITALVAALSSRTSGLARLITGWDPTNYWDANFIGELSPETMITGASFTLEFFAPDPGKTAV